MRASLCIAAAATLALPGLAAGQTAPDLSLGNVSLSPSQATVGSTITVSGLVVATPSFIGNVGVSLEAPFAPAGSLGSTAVFVNGTNANFTMSFVVPAATSPGLYTVTAFVDPANLVAESVETNNSLSATPALRIVAADLVAQTLTGAPIATGGAPYNIEASIRNIGQAAANGFVYAYYLGRRPTGPPLLQVGPVDLAIGATTMRQDVLTLPATPGPVTISLWVNANVQVPEVNLNNNIRTLDITVRVPQPDLVGSVQAFNGSAEVGQSVSFTANVQNLGDAESAAATYAYVLSLDPIIDAADREIFRGTTPGVIPRGSTEATNDTFTIPVDVVPSVYYLGVLADPDGQIAESDETNNAAPGRLIQIFEPELLVTTTSLPDATQNVAYSTRLMHIGGAFDPTWSIIGGGLPAGMLLSPSTGEIQGRPSEAGTFPLTVRATSGGATADAALSLTVIPNTAPLAVETTQLPSGLVGRAYQVELIASGGLEPYRWTGQNLPVGLAVDANGAISGTPATAGTARIEVEVSDAQGQVATANLLLDVLDPAATIRIMPLDLPVGIVGNPYCDPTTVRFGADRGTPPLTWSIVDTPPPGLSLSAEGELCGTPTEAGTFDFIVRVQDSTGLFDTASFRVEVVSDQSVTITTASLPNGVVGQAYAAQLEAAGQAPFTFALRQDGLPPGLSISAEGAISGTPTETGAFAFVVEVTDAAAAEGSALLSIRVLEPGSILAGQDSAGCGCRSTGEPRDLGLLLLGLLGVWGLRRRR